MSLALALALTLMSADADAISAGAAPAPIPPTAPTPTAAPTATTPVKTLEAADAAALEQRALDQRAPRAEAADDVGRKVPIVVLDLRAEGVEPALASAVSSVVGSELFDLGVLQVTTEEDVRRMMDFEQMKLILACQDEAKCLQSFQNSLGAEMLVTGSVGRSGSAGDGDVVVGLVLTDLATGVPVGREVATVKSPSALVSEVRVALGRLFRPVLAQRGGTLVVLGNEDGATVLLDGAAVGVTPFRKNDVPAGPHRIEATKDGFLKGSVDITVQPTQVSAVDVLLIPSNELAATHERNNWILRGVSGVTAGVGVAALGTGVGIWAWQYDLLNNPKTGYVTRFSKDSGGAIILPEARFNEIDRARLTAYALMGSALPLFVAAGVLFAVSEDPAKYDALKGPE